MEPIKTQLSAVLSKQRTTSLLLCLRKQRRPFDRSDIWPFGLLNNSILQDNQGENVLGIRSRANPWPSFTDICNYDMEVGIILWHPWFEVTHQGWWFHCPPIALHRDHSHSLIWNLLFHNLIICFSFLHHKQHIPGTPLSLYVDLLMLRRTFIFTFLFTLEA